MQSTTTSKWLKAASALLIAFGMLTAAAAHPSASGLAEFLADIIIWPIDGAQSLAAPETRLLAAIAGGVMAGWGAMMWLAATHLLSRDYRLARKLILSSVIVWFVVDGAASIAAGAPLNAGLNVVFLLLFTVPLASAPAETAKTA